MAPNFPIFSPPAFLGATGYSSGFNLSGIRTISFGLAPADIAKRLGVDSISLSNTQEPVRFARVIPKIGFVFAAAEGKLNLIRNESPVVPAILGKTDDIGRWVGTITGPTPKYEGLIHQILLHEDRRGLLFAEIHLFSDSEASRYGVVLGTLL